MLTSCMCYLLYGALILTVSLQNRDIHVTEGKVVTGMSVKAFHEQVVEMEQLGGYLGGSHRVSSVCLECFRQCCCAKCH